MLGREYAQRTRLQRAVNAEVASLHDSPVAETVDNARKPQGLAETSPMRQLSPVGYQRRHGVKDDVETGEALGTRRRNLVEEMPAITVSGKCRHRHQGGGSGRSTADGRAAKRARREGRPCIRSTRALRVQFAGRLKLTPMARVVPSPRILGGILLPSKDHMSYPSFHGGGNDNEALYLHFTLLPCMIEWMSC